jgi:hypothetical protein
MLDISGLFISLSKLNLSWIQSNFILFQGTLAELAEPPGV